MPKEQNVETQTTKSRDPEERKSHEITYKKSEGAKKITIEITSPNQPLDMLDVLRALSSLMTQILTSGKY